MSYPQSICFYFQVHQPFRLNLPKTLETANWDEFLQGPTGENPSYVYGNQNIFELVAKNCYIPATKMWLELLTNNPNLKLTLSLSGVFLEQCLNYGQVGEQTLQGFRDLLQTNQVELLTETYYHSLSFFISLEDYVAQVEKHHLLIQKLFNYTPKGFRNTELIYNNYMGEVIRRLGFTYTVADGVKQILNFKSPNTAYSLPHTDLEETDTIFASHHRVTQKPPVSPEDFKILLRNYDVTAEIIFLENKAAQFIDALSKSQAQHVNVFTDFEIFGQINHSSTGVFDSLQSIADFLKDHNISSLSASEVASHVESAEEYHCPVYTSWANQQQNLSSWRGNEKQETAFKELTKLYHLLMQVKHIHPEEYAKAEDFWRKLSTSDNFYYMSELDGSDGEIHSMFNAYPSPAIAHKTFLDIAQRFETYLTQKIQ
jgi:alpha-amylase